MTSYGLEAVHAALYAALGDVVRVLEDNGLPYSVMCGTLLGAVRHQAIIPWDDDVDIVLPRDSFDRFAALYPAQCGEGFSLDWADTWVPRVRRAGSEAFVDLFILDPLPEGRVQRAWKLFRLKSLQGMLKRHTDYRRFSIGKRALLLGTRALGLLVPRRVKLAAYHRVARSGGVSRLTHMSDGAFGLLSMTFAADAFDAPVPATLGPLTVRIPRDAAVVLTMLYGSDYMTPPPERARRPLHLDR